MSTPVIVASERPLLAELVYGHLESAGFSLPRRIRSTPDHALLAVQSLRPQSEAVVCVLCDPVGEDWFGAAASMRADARVGVLVIAARAAFWATRHWRQKVAGRPVASALLTLENDLADVGDAVREVSVRPEGSDFWPDGPRHPAAFWLTEDGRTALDVFRDPRFQTLRWAAAGEQQRAIAARLGISTDQVRRQLNALAETLGASTDVQLGRRRSSSACSTNRSPEPMPSSSSPSSPSPTTRSSPAFAIADGAGTASSSRR